MCGFGPPSISLLIRMMKCVVGCLLVVIIHVCFGAAEILRVRFCVAAHQASGQGINEARLELYALRIYIMHVLHFTCSDTGYSFCEAYSLLLALLAFVFSFGCFYDGNNGRGSNVA